MAYTNSKQKIDLLREQILSHGKLTPEQLKKINYKFRLEWNYNSNSMEGNTLTIEETRSVMVGNIMVDKKPYKDIAEMKGHDEVISDILKIGKGELRLSEARIKQIHEAIMYEETEEEKAKIGKWKETNNYIYNYKGERFDFVDFKEVQDRMHDLLNRTNAAIDAIQNGSKKALHPLDVAFNFHLEYVNIHPFYDANGRTARILTNLILIALEYPPFWITEPQRAPYSNYLGDIQGYGGDPNLFHNFLAELVLRSQQLIVDVIEGRDIEADDDLDKEIAVWKRQLEKKDGLLLKSNDVIENVYKASLTPLFSHYLNKSSNFDDLFISKTIYYSIETNKYKIDDSSIFNDFFSGNSREYVSGRLLKLKDLNNIKLEINFKDFKNNGINLFGKTSFIYIQFSEYNYIITTHSGGKANNTSIEKLYSESLTEEEIKSIVKDTVAKLFEDIKASIKS